MNYQRRGMYSTNMRLFEIHVTVDVRELITDGESIPASAKDIRPDHRGEIIAVMQHLAKQIHEEGQQ